MPRRVRIVFAVSLTVVVGLIACQLLRLQPQSEPVYQGKALSVWLEDPLFTTDFFTWDPGRSTPAIEALRQMGTNTLPFLIQDLQSKNWPLRHQVYWLNTKLLNRKINLGPSASFRHMRAVHAMIALGPMAKPAIPALGQCLDRDDIAVEAASILGDYSSGSPQLGPEAAVPLLRALTNRNLEVRRIAANSLGLMQTSPKEVVPALIRALEDPSAEVRAMAAWSLGGPIYKQEADTIVPALIKMLEDTAPAVRRFTAWRLGPYGARAHACVPKLVSLLNDSDQEVRKESANALKLIDPEAATKAGIK